MATNYFPAGAPFEPSSLAVNTPGYSPYAAYDAAAVEARLREEAAKRGLPYDPSDARDVSQNYYNSGGTTTSGDLEGAIGLVTAKYDQRISNQPNSSDGQYHAYPQGNYNTNLGPERYIKSQSEIDEDNGPLSWERLHNVPGASPGTFSEAKPSWFTSPQLAPDANPNARDTEADPMATWSSSPMLAPNAAPGTRDTFTAPTGGDLADDVQGVPLPDGGMAGPTQDAQPVGIPEDQRAAFAAWEQAQRQGAAANVYQQRLDAYRAALNPAQTDIWRR